MSRLTPEERAVINAAIEWRLKPSEATGYADVLSEAARKLIITCPECNAGGHTCPGDGNPIGHGDPDCGEHDDDAPRETRSGHYGALLPCAKHRADGSGLVDDCSACGIRRNPDYGAQYDPLSGELIPAGQDAELERQGREMAGPSLMQEITECAQGTLTTWLRMLDIEAAGTSQMRLNWQTDTEATLSGGPFLNDEITRVRITVQVEDLGLLPPIGPENDLGVYGIDEYGGSSDEEAEERATGEDDPQWIARTMADVRAGDTIRPIGGQGTPSRVSGRYLPPDNPRDAVKSNAGSWHVVSGGEKHWDDHVVQPGEVWLELDGAPPRMLRPTFGVEILLAPSEVAAIELLGWENRLEMRTNA